MKSPIEWDEIPDVAAELVELIELASSECTTEMDCSFEEGKNGYGENGTVTLRLGNHTFQLAAYEVEE